MPHLGPLRIPFDPLWFLFGPGSVLGVLWLHFRPPWLHFGPPWLRFGLPWLHWGRLKELFRPTCGVRKVQESTSPRWLEPPKVLFCSMKTHQTNILSTNLSLSESDGLRWFFRCFYTRCIASPLQKAPWPVGPPILQLDPYLGHTHAYSIWDPH
jgi:hypothetical protein